MSSTGRGAGEALPEARPDVDAVDAATKSTKSGVPNFPKAKGASPTWSIASKGRGLSVPAFSPFFAIFAIFALI